jgi:hypothetical protein
VRTRTAFPPLLLQDRSRAAGGDRQRLVVAPPAPSSSISAKRWAGFRGYLRHRAPLLSPAAGASGCRWRFLGRGWMPQCRCCTDAGAGAQAQPGDRSANPLFYETGFNMLKGRLRSHPEVARRHYADVLAASA